MRKFLLLFTKEIRELLTPQMLIPFLAVILVFYFLGNVAGKQIQKQTKAKENIAVLDLDNSALSYAAENVIGQVANVEKISASNDEEFLEKLKTSGLNVGLVIPQGFEKSVLKSHQATIKSYGLINSFNVLAAKKYAVLSASTNATNSFLSDQLINTASGGVSAEALKNPLKTESFVASNDNFSPGDPNAILNYVMSQTNYLPAVLFVVIIMASQIIAAAVATEKENKTLETLLSLPISRKTIVASKMLAAGVISLVMAGIYMYGIRTFTNGLTTAMEVPPAGGESISQITNNLGLQFTAGGYLEFGAILFLEILLALAVAMILGAFSEDAKSAQGVVAPLMILVMIPYFVILFLDINTLSAPIRFIIYAIPFSHMFLASQNILMGNNLFLLYGGIYLLILFIIFVFLAARIFSSDLILTLKLNFFRRKKQN